jgi:hypothetical protein
MSQPKRQPLDATKMGWPVLPECITLNAPRDLMKTPEAGGDLEELPCYRPPDGELAFGVCGRWTCLHADDVEVFARAGSDEGLLLR